MPGESYPTLFMFLLFCLLLILLSHSFFKSKHLWQYFRALPQLHIRLISQLPVGAGLGSSAAFSVCLAAVLLRYTGQISPSVHTTAEGRGDSTLTKRDFHDVSDADRLLINKWAFLGEKIIHGQPSGIDNSVSTLGNFCVSFQN